MIIHMDGLLWWAGFVLLAVYIVVQRRRGLSRSNLFFSALMWVYLMLVARGTLFPIPIYGPDDPARQVPFFHRVNLIPFHFGSFSITLRNFIWIATPNILLTVPFGFLIPFLTRVRGRHFLWLPFAAGLSIEAAQLAISSLVGYQYRVFDINDMIFNTVGVVVGYLSFRVLAWVYRLTLDRLRLRPGGLAGYVYAAAERARCW